MTSPQSSRAYKLLTSISALLTVLFWMPFGAEPMSPKLWALTVAFYAAPLTTLLIALTGIHHLRIVALITGACSLVAGTWLGTTTFTLAGIIILAIPGLLLLLAAATRRS